MSFFLSLFRTTLQQRLRRIRSWVILLLIPCLIVGIHVALPDESVSAPVQVGVALPEDGGDALWALLEARSGTVLTFIAADMETIDRNIAAGRWDCGVIVNEDFAELLEQMDTKRIFTLHVGEGSAVYPLVREAVAACMASLVTEPIAQDYLQDAGIPHDSSSLYQVLGSEDRVIVTMQTADGTPLHPFELGSRSVQKILSWVISAAILVWMLLCAHDLGRWSHSGATKRILTLRSYTCVACARMAADWLLILLPSLIAMIAIGVGVYGCAAVCGYSLFWGAVGILAARLPAVWQSVPLLPPFAVVLSLLLSGALLDLGSLFPAFSDLGGFIPANLYMQTCNTSPSAILPLLASAAVLLGISAIMDQIKKR